MNSEPARATCCWEGAVGRLRDVWNYRLTHSVRISSSWVLGATLLGCSGGYAPDPQQTAGTTVFAQQACAHPSSSASAWVTKNALGVFVLTSVVLDKEAIFSPGKRTLHHFDGIAFSSVADLGFTESSVPNEGLWSLTDSDLMVRGRTSHCSLELFHPETSDFSCALGSLREPEFLHVVDAEHAYSIENHGNQGSVLSFDGKDFVELYRLNAADQELVGYNFISGLWADERAVYISATAGVYVARHGRDLERIFSPPSPPPNGQFLSGGIYATRPESIWVLQHYGSRPILAHFDGSEWSTLWPPEGSDQQEGSAELGWTNRLWGHGDQIYLLADGVLSRFAAGRLEAILGGREQGARKVLDFWGVAADEIYIVSRPPPSAECLALEVHRFAGKVFSPL